ncbi:hypothetical protein IGA96_24155, partial [Pseudomonas aeruginosa]|uniref:hypothetical protein n=1 Tax=Pseudomonas aeruginosa TaxID=287 RepID=UPI002238059B
MNVYRKVSRSAVTWLCSALLAASGHAWAEDWWVVHKGDDPAELDVFLADADSLAPVPGIENAWQVQIAMLFDSFHLLSAHQYRCDTREVKVVNAKTFSNNGQPTNLQFTFAKGWTPLPNESHEAVLQFICAPQQRERNGMRSTGRGVPLQAVITAVGMVSH